MPQTSQPTFAAITHRSGIRSAWTESRHRPAAAECDTPPNYVAGVADTATAGLPSVAKSTRPITAGVCTRVDHVIHQPMRRQCFTSSFPLRQQRQQQQQQQQQQLQLQAEEENRLKPKTAPPSTRTFELGPGLRLTRSRDKLLVTLDSEKLFEAREKKAEMTLKHGRAVEESQRDQLLGQMQRHLDSLVVMLEEERMKHKEEMEALSEEMQSQMLAQEQRYEGKIVDLLAQHQEELSESERQREEEAKAAKREYELMQKELKSQINDMNTSFAEFKSSYTQEMQDKWSAKEAELVRQGEQLAQRLVDETTNQLMSEREAEIASLQREQDQELEQLRRQQAEEVERLQERYSDVEGTVQRLDAATKDLVAKEQKLQSVTEQLNSKEREIEILEKTLLETRSEFSALQSRFNEQVKLVEDKFKSQLETLRLEALDLRKAYITKCQQLVEARKHDDNQLQDRLRNSKTIMQEAILARDRFNSSIAAIDS